MIDREWVEQNCRRISREEDVSRIPALVGLSDEEYDRLVPYRARLVAWRGSHTHGTYIPPSAATGHDDIDLITVYTDMRPSAYFGTDGQVWTGRDVKIREWDGVCYQLQHFAKLAAACNPNVIATLWLQPEHYLRVDWLGDALIQARDMFSSKLAAMSFGGYASGQLRRMTAWKDQGHGLCHCKGEFHEAGCALKDEKGRGSSKLYATGFMGEKRKALVKQFGYDVKNAAHLVRLLRMGREFLETGQLSVWRADAAELKAIKRGEWTLEQVRLRSDAEFGRLNAAVESSPLPARPDFEAINQMVTRLMCRAMERAIKEKTA